MAEQYVLTKVDKSGKRVVVELTDAMRSVIKLVTSPVRPNLEENPSLVDTLKAWAKVDARIEVITSTTFTPEDRIEFITSEARKRASKIAEVVAL